MNLLKIIRSTVYPQNYSWIAARIGLGNIRWQTTDVPPKEDPNADVSTKVKPTKQSNLMEFFDTSENLYESKIIHGEFKCFRWDLEENEVFFIGRWWYLDELRLKSNEDLHKLWYVLLKERNRLLTMEEEYRHQHELFPSPERVDKVNKSIELPER